MTKKAKILFLWHMHQPYYKDVQKNIYLMPWVRLHATKGYFDIPLVMEKYEIKGCINIVPSLLEQIEDYVNNSAIDKWKIYSERNPETLDEDAKAFILKNFFMLHWDRLIKTSPRYSEILAKRQKYESKLNWNEMTKFFSDEEYLDLQVLFNLKWFGFMAREKYPFLKELDEKDRFFTVNEKEKMLEIQKEILAKIIPLYKRLYNEDKLELSFTPFYHPIFPLVYDTEISKRSEKNAPMPKQYSYPQDAIWHLKEGKKFAEEKMEKQINGMWPAEGSVSPEIIAPAMENNVKWLATDEGILFNSIGNSNKFEVLYKPWEVRNNDSKVVAFFRDKYLSDLFGFSFSNMDANSATDVFLHYISEINKNSKEETPVVSIMLDGENAWESYPENGKYFLETLFSKISSCEQMETDTFSNVVLQNEKKDLPVVHNIHSGSWINSNYMIWIGNKEDNEAWEYLRTVRKFVEEEFAKTTVPTNVQKEVLKAIYRAEGSDWFWWYGDSFSTENDYLFDRLFRRHLRQVYRLLNKTYPTFLDIPISKSKTKNTVIEPATFITPKIDGFISSYYDWSFAGIYENLSAHGGAMYNSIKLVEKLYFGYDMNHFYFRVDFIDPIVFNEYKKNVLKCYIVNSGDYNFSIPLFKFEKTDFSVFKNVDNKTFNEIVSAGQVAINDVVEFSLDIKKLSLNPGEEISVYFKIFSKDDLEIERIPSSGSLKIVVPDEKSQLRLWDV